MSDMVKHYFDRCGGDIRYGSWNAVATGDIGDFTNGSWDNIVTPASGGRVVVFDILINWKSAGGPSVFGIKVGSKIIGNYFLNNTISIVYDSGATEIIDSWTENSIYPFRHTPTIPVLGAVDASLAVLAAPVAGYGGSDATQPSLQIQYGLVAATEA